MVPTPAQPALNLHALLLLGRVSNLPIVWSNCLAGWVLAGGESTARFGLLCAAGTCLYLGGMFLNDAFDAGFDRQRRKERPIPSGLISEARVWQAGWLWLTLGVAATAALGKTPFLLATLLAGTIVLYNAIHKRTPLAVILMGACRFQLYLLAAAAAGGPAGHAIWCGLALGTYVAGLSYLARRESIPGPLHWWPTLTFAAPILLALLLNGEAVDGPNYRERAFYLSLLLVIWILPSLRYAYGREPRQLGFAVSNLLAGIVLVDLLATVGEPWFVLPAFALFFVATLALQRFVPAT
jgi:4-hydroxybenzoate polyprenyltransferase